MVASSVGLKLWNTIRRYDKFEFQVFFRVGYTHRNTLLPSVKVIVIRIRIPKTGGTRGLEGEKVGHEESGNPKPRNRAGESTSENHLVRMGEVPKLNKSTSSTTLSNPINWLLYCIIT